MSTVAENMGMKVGLIGMGVMGRNHFRVLLEMGANVRWYDPRCAELSQGLLGTDRHYMCEEDIYNWADAIIIATPTSTHYRLVTIALQKKKAVLCEKPLCDNAVDMMKLHELAQARRCTLMVGFTERYNPVIGGLFGIMMTTNIGSILKVEIERVNNQSSERYRPEGVILDLAVHDYDLLVYFFGVGVELLSSELIPQRDTPTVFCLAKFLVPEKFTASVKTSWIDIEKRRRILIYTDKQVIEADLLGKRIRKISRDDPVVIDVTQFDGEPLARELESFLSHASIGSTPPSKDSLGLRAIQIVEEIQGERVES